MPTTTQQQPYTLGQLTTGLAALKEKFLDMANEAYRGLHDVEDMEEKIVAWRSTGTRAG